MLAQASEEYPVYLNGTVGAGFSTSGDRGTDFVFGLRGGVGVHRNDNGLISFGLAFDKLNGESLEVGSNSASVSGSALMIESVTRQFWGSAVYTGGRFGLGFNTLSAKTATDEASVSANTFVVGPVVGYEFNVDGPYAANLELAWLVSTAPTFNNVEGSSYSSLLLQAGFLFNL